MAKIPESELIKKEFVLRVLYPDSSVKLSKQSSIRFIALSLGLISPNESRTAVLDILEVLLDSHMEGKGLTSYEIIEKLKSKNIDEKTIYYHLKKLADYGIITKKSGEYFVGDGFEKDFTKIVENLYKSALNDMLSSVKEVYLSLKHR